MNDIDYEAKLLYEKYIKNTKQEQSIRNIAYYSTKIVVKAVEGALAIGSLMGIFWLIAAPVNPLVMVAGVVAFVWLIAKMVTRMFVY